VKAHSAKKVAQRQGCPVSRLPSSDHQSAAATFPPLTSQHQTHAHKSCSRSYKPTEAPSAGRVTLKEPTTWSRYGPSRYARNRLVLEICIDDVRSNPARTQPLSRRRSPRFLRRLREQPLGMMSCDRGRGAFALCGRSMPASPTFWLHYF
jgi:hypothetical protein